MKLITLLTLIITSLSGIAQNGFEIIIIDNIGRTDTVVFAMDFSATSSIDSTFGEIDLYNLPKDSLEIRSIQRDSANHACITNTAYQNSGSPLYYNNNIDLKRDFKNLTLGSPEDNNFEFTINAVEYPVTIITDFTKWFPQGAWGTWIGLLKSNCTIIEVNNPDYNNIDTLLIDSSADIVGLVLKFDHEVGINESNSNYSFEISPNPTSSSFKLSTNSVISKNAQIIITTIDGQIILKEKVRGKNNFDLSNYNSGMYLIHLKDDNGNFLTKKIIKR